MASYRVALGGRAIARAETREPVVDYGRGTRTASGCRKSWLDTFSFQAPGFYEKNGYVVFGELSEYSPGHKRYFLRKRLHSSGGGQR
jgi:hypothetical protein